MGHLYISLVIGCSPIFCISPAIQNEIQFRKLYFTRVSRFRALSLSSLKGKSCTGDFRINPLIWREECSHKYLFRLMRWIQGGVMWLPCWMWKFHWNAWLLVTFLAPPLPIIIREALALKIPSWLVSLPASIPSLRLRGHAVYRLFALGQIKLAWAKLFRTNQAIKTTLQFYIALSLVYVSPGDNLTDVPSRVPPASVCILTPRVWKEIENSWGPHSIYLIALHSKAPIAAQGCRLIYFSLCPTKGSAGVIVFSQTFHPLDNS